MPSTDNASRYHFADFTRTNYRSLVKLALETYPLGTYSQALGPTGRLLVWRHDLDFSVHAGVKLAEIEAAEGMIATYFFLLHSEFYNLLEKECLAAARRILSLGHRLGLHFDHHAWPIRGVNDLEEAVAFEREVLEKYLEARVEALSFHIPDEAIAKFQAETYAGLVNAYSTHFKRDFGYCSDSNGYWRFRRLEDVLRAGQDPRLQVLTHPEYWQDEIMSPHERVERCIQGRAEKARIWYRETLRKAGREDVDW